MASTVRVRSLVSLSLSPMLLSVIAVGWLITAPLLEVADQRDALVDALDQRRAAHQYTVHLEQDVLQVLAGLSGDIALAASQASLDTWGQSLGDQQRHETTHRRAVATHDELAATLARDDRAALALAWEPAFDAAADGLQEANELVDLRMERLAGSAPSAAGLEPFAMEAREHLENGRTSARYARALAQVAVTVAIAGNTDTVEVAIALREAGLHQEAFAMLDHPEVPSALQHGEAITSLAQGLLENRTLGQEGLGALWSDVTSALTTIDDIRDQEQSALRGGLEAMERRATAVAWLAGGGTTLLATGAAAAAITLERRVVRPTRSMHAAVQSWDGTRPIEGLPEPHDDELGDLTQAVQAMTQRIHDTTRRLQDALAQAQADRDELQRSYDRLAEGERLRRHILNTASHELRTPLTPMRLKLQVLRSGAKGAFNDEQAKTLDALDSNLRRLLDVVERMTQLRDLQEGETLTHLVRTDLADVAFAAANAARPAFDQAGIELHVDAQDPVLVQADVARMRQVMAILLDNACKFTPRGGHTTITVRDDQSIEVQDDGAGMTPDDLKRLFRAFERGFEEDDTREAAGLDLAIARALIERMGGTITAQSPGPGQGSTFRIQLPAANL